MIDKLTLINFRSFRAQDIRLSNFNCLIGPNNSGKSNFLDSLSFLGDVARGGLYSAMQNRRAQGLRFYGAPADEPIIIEVLMDAPAAVKDAQVRYTLGFRLENPFMEREIVNLVLPKGQLIALYSANYDPRRGGSYSFSLGGETVKGQSGVSSNTVLHDNRGVDLGEATPVLAHLKSCLSGIATYRFLPDRLKAEGPASYTERLAKDGSNFASYLHGLHSGNRGAFGRIEENLKASFPEIKELLTPLSEAKPGQTEIGILEKWHKHVTSGSELSDGLIGFLAHLVVISGPNTPYLVAFEEPENYINPRLLEKLVDMLRTTSKEMQVIITTHSTSVLNHLELSDILLMSRKDGESKVVAVADQPTLKKALRGWALGDAYVSGAIDDDD